MIRSILPQDLRRRAGTAGANRITASAPQLRLASVLVGICMLPLAGCALFQDDPQAGQGGDTTSIVPPSNASAEASARSASSSSESAQAASQAQGQPNSTPVQPAESGPPVDGRQPAGSALPPGTMQTGTVQTTGGAPAAGAMQTTASTQAPGAAGSAQPAEQAAGPAYTTAAAAGQQPVSPSDQGEPARAVPVASNQSAPAPATSSPLSLAPSASEAAAAQVAAAPAAPEPVPPPPQYQPPVPQYQTPAAQYQPAAPQYSAPTAQYQPPVVVPQEAIGAPGAVGQAAVKAAQAAPLGAAGSAAGWQAGAGAQLPAATGAAGSAVVSAGGSRHGSVADQLFAREAALDALAELDAAQMAQTQAQSAPVRQYAARQLEAYGKARQMLLSLAAIHDDPDATALDPAHQRTLEDLAKLHGQMFDVGYLRAEAAAHQKTAELYEWILATGRDPSVKGYAVGVLPTVLQELESAQGLLVQMGPASE